MSVDSYEELKAHFGHHIVCVCYGSVDDPANVALECEDCGEVLLDFDRPPDREQQAEKMYLWLQQFDFIQPDRIEVEWDNHIRLTWDNGKDAPADKVEERFAADCLTVAAVGRKAGAVDLWCFFADYAVWEEVSQE